MPKYKGIFRGLSRTPSVQEMVDQVTASDELDQALQKLTEATRENERACRKVQARQSSGELKLWLSIPPPSVLAAE